MCCVFQVFVVCDVVCVCQRVVEGVWCLSQEIVLPLIVKATFMRKELMQQSKKTRLSRDGAPFKTVNEFVEV